MEKKGQMLEWSVAPRVEWSGTTMFAIQAYIFIVKEGGAGGHSRAFFGISIPED